MNIAISVVNSEFGWLKGVEKPSLRLTEKKKPSKQKSPKHLVKEIIQTSTERKLCPPAPYMSYSNIMFKPKIKINSLFV